MEQDPKIHGAASLSRDILERIVASSSEPVLLLDAQDPSRPVVYANPAYEALSGYGAAELIGRPWPLLDRDSIATPELERLRIAVGRAEPCDVSLSGIRKDGSTWSGDVSLQPLHTAHGELEYLLCRRNVGAAEYSERSTIEVGLLTRALGQARRHIASMDRTDHATGLLRYEHFTTLLAHDLGIARREKHDVSVVAFDIVELDVYRRTFGQKAADSCLRMIGAQVAGTFRRAGDSCTRCDESMIIAAVVGQSPEQAALLGERVVAKVRRLGLHNPRARSGRQIWVRHAVVGADPHADDATGVVERAKSELAGNEPAPERYRTVG